MNRIRFVSLTDIPGRPIRFKRIKGIGECEFIHLLEE